MEMNDLRLRRLVRAVVNESTDETTVGHMRMLTEKSAGQVSRRTSYFCVYLSRLPPLPSEEEYYYIYVTNNDGVSSVTGNIYYLLVPVLSMFQAIEKATFKKAVWAVLLGTSKVKRKESFPPGSSPYDASFV